jgi:hypothetical protein
MIRTVGKLYNKWPIGIENGQWYLNPVMPCSAFK